jgi:hypothetical protein
MQKSIHIATGLVTASTIVQILGFLIALPNHLGDPTWSAHAQFHHVLGWFWLTGLDSLLLILVWGPLRRRERWSFWAVLIGFVIAQGGYFLAMLLVWEGRPPETWFHFALGANTLLGAIGIAIFARILNQPS